MLHPPSSEQTLVSCSLAYLWHTLSLVFGYLVTSICWLGFQTVQNSSGSIIAVNINDNHIQYYHMDKVRL